MAVLICSLELFLLSLLSLLDIVDAKDNFDEWLVNWYSVIAFRA